MARIPMTSCFVIIPEGEYVFRIYDATYDEDFGRIEIKLVNAQGATHTERFSIKDKNDEYNEKALNAFSYFAKTAMNDYTMEDCCWYGNGVEWHEQTDVVGYYT